MKKLFYSSLLLIWTLTWFGAGFIFYDIIHNELVGAVRGGGRTGFWLKSGEDIGIGTSTLSADIRIYETSTTTIALDGTVMGCLRILDTDAGGYTNITVLNGVIGTSTDADCGF